uniref:Uncharacterized protein n=1 Tax=Oreochromis aureus TaxID=47969 RepID=A0A668S766_OREAU
MRNILGGGRGGLGAHMNGRALGCVWVSAPHNEPPKHLLIKRQPVGLSFEKKRGLRGRGSIKAWPHQPYLCENILTATFILLEIKLCDPME